jgi:hypothetical protein
VERYGEGDRENEVEWMIGVRGVRGVRAEQSD